jgi:hypothetical protein
MRKIVALAFLALALAGGVAVVSATYSQSALRLPFPGCRTSNC